MREGFRELGHQPVLDGVRGLAWLTVFLAHGFHIGRFAFGQVAMFVFFALSGFLITELLYEEYAKFGRISLRNFCVRRGLRLLPALVLFLGAWLLVVLIFQGDSFTTTVPGGGSMPGVDPVAALEGVGAALGYVTNWFDTFNVINAYVPLGHLWSLAVEEQFYLAWAPALVVLLALAHRLGACGGLRRPRIVDPPRVDRRTATRVWRWGFWGAASLAVLSFVDVAMLRHASSLTTSLDMSTDARAGAFLIGAAVAAAWSGRARWIALCSGRLRPVVVGTTIAIWLWAAWVFDHSVSVAVFGATWTLVSFASALIVVVVVDRPPREQSWMNAKPVTYLGRRSYALYLWHYVWLTWFARFGLVGVVAAFAATLATSEMSWQLVEQRALNLKRRFSATMPVPRADTALDPRPYPCPPVQRRRRMLAKYETMSASSWTELGCSPEVSSPCLPPVTSTNLTGTCASARCCANVSDWSALTMWSSVPCKMRNGGSPRATWSSGLAVSRTADERLGSAWNTVRITPATYDPQSETARSAGPNSSTTACTELDSR
jgi:peptidoglycan/LPS O-acetylase OafA/YrhL